MRQAHPVGQRLRVHAGRVVHRLVHGVLHLCGYDHETDDGEMLALQDRVMDELR